MYNLYNSLDLAKNKPEGWLSPNGNFIKCDAHAVMAEKILLETLHYKDTDISFEDSQDKLIQLGWAVIHNPCLAPRARVDFYRDLSILQRSYLVKEGYL